jgi:hypothetical protein
MLHRLGRDDELLYKPDNPRLLARPYVYAAGCSSTSTTSHSATPPACAGNPADKWLFPEQMAHPLITGKEQSGHAQAILGGRGGRTDTRPTAAPAPMPSTESCSAGSATGA